MAEISISWRLGTSSKLFTSEVRKKKAILILNLKS